MSSGGALTEDSVKKFDELIERFRFLEFQGAFWNLGGEEEKQKNILQTGLDFVRTIVQSVPDDGYWGPDGWVSRILSLQDGRMRSQKIISKH